MTPEESLLASGLRAMSPRESWLSLGLIALRSEESWLSLGVTKDELECLQGIWDWICIPRSPQNNSSPPYRKLERGRNKIHDTISLKKGKKGLFSIKRIDTVWFVEHGLSKAQIFLFVKKGLWEKSLWFDRVNSFQEHCKAGLILWLKILMKLNHFVCHTHF